MFLTKATSPRFLSRAHWHVKRPTAMRLYATEYEQRTTRTLKTSSRLTWLTTTAAIGAAALFYTNTTMTPSSRDPPSPPAQPVASGHVDDSESGHRHETAYASDVPKPVEDRHGDSVTKHSIAAHKNQNKVREGKFSGREFDNHVQVHSPGKPDGDFETKR